MTAPKKTMAVVGLLLPGILATPQYSDGQSTAIIEPQQIGSTTADGNLVYSLNYCTVVESTQCQLSLSTANGVTPESSAAYPIPSAESSVAVSVAPTPVEPVPTDAVISSVVSVTEGTPGAPQSTTEGSSVVVSAPTVISTTDNIGNPTLVTSTALGLTGSGVTTDSVVSTESSSTGGEQTNSTSTETHGGPSGSLTVPSAPDHTGTGATIQLFPAAVLGAAAVVVASLF